MKSKEAVLSAFLLILTGLVLYLFIQIHGLPSFNVVPTERSTSTTVRYVPTCGDVTGDCEATAETNECSRKQAKELLGQMLEDPMNVQTCKNLVEEIGKSCPFGCTLDYSSLIVVPGKMQFRFREEDERCVATGQRPVKVKATCRPKKADGKADGALPP